MKSQEFIDTLAEKYRIRDSIESTRTKGDEAYQAAMDLLLAKINIEIREVLTAMLEAEQ